MPVWVPAQFQSYAAFPAVMPLAMPAVHSPADGEARVLVPWSVPQAPLTMATKVALTEQAAVTAPVVYVLPESEPPQPETDCTIQPALGVTVNEGVARYPTFWDAEIEPLPEATVELTA